LPKGKEPPQVEKKVNDYVHLVLHSFYLSNRPPHRERERAQWIYIDASFYFYVCVLSRFLLCLFPAGHWQWRKTPEKVSSTWRPTSSSKPRVLFYLSSASPLARLDILCLCDEGPADDFPFLTSQSASIRLDSFYCWQRRFGLAACFFFSTQLRAYPPQLLLLLRLLIRLTWRVKRDRAPRAGGMRHTVTQKTSGRPPISDCH
jgi:hypothetical protein